ncbi:hypothetical protein HanHA300_Chr01g0032661 [Helianthus annuus]|nr:hypothetical protein HanHA300_Chr01g0032661 [Helianthus annuus]
MKNLLLIPKSSPIRTTPTTTIDEFAPPIIMFPRSKSTRATRSRDSRANHPIFIRKLKINNTNEEPSSPKVTCMGQVKVKRSNRTKTTSSRSSATVRRCKFLRRIKPRWLRSLWRGRISFFRCDCCRKSEKLHVSTEKQIARRIGDVIGAFNDELIAEPPLRNAVLLTRSRSAPYRYSFADNYRIGGEDEDNSGGDEGFINGEEEYKADVNVKPLNLSRCKSEPARTGDKFFVSFSFSA